ncbi:MAG: glucose-6-phosphate isomerase, partial [Alphaproteobacteria bacterium]
MVVTGEPQAIVTSPAPNQLPAWQALQAHQIQVAPLHMRELFAGDPDRWQRFSLQACDLFLDYSKNRITADTMVLLAELARQCGVEAWRDRMFAGDMVNGSEHRAALHVALRAPAGQPFPTPVGDVMPAVTAARRRMREVSDALRQGRWAGHSGKAITDVVHIGIGGSHLGPEMGSRALAASGSGAPAVRFVSSVDGDNLIGALAQAEAETTLFMVASKSFSTAETMANAASARAWLLERGGFPAAAVADHFVAITAKATGARDFGIPDRNILPLWDWVGGRFSLCSSVGLPVAIAAGMDAF